MYMSFNLHWTALKKSYIRVNQWWDMLQNRLNLPGSVYEIDINECESNPCGNSNDANSCVDKVNGYECNCRSCDCSTVRWTAHCAINETHRTFKVTKILRE
ncbi:hypothetical protein LSAT2_023204 [Lamellibrachia satsuma]|nr:hypothetical protein LSAT2_023204 [Lamellibrachia satsuma]